MTANLKLFQCFRNFFYKNSIHKIYIDILRISFLNTNIRNSVFEAVISKRERVITKISITKISITPDNVNDAELQKLKK